MESRRSAPALRLCALAVVVSLATLHTVDFLGGRVAAGQTIPNPSIGERVVATYYGGSLTVTGEHLGEHPASRSVRIDYGSRSTTVSADSPLIDVWQDNLVRLSLPPEAQSGQLTVVVDGVESEPVDLFVFAYAPVSVPPTLGTVKHELAVALAADGWLWFNQEFHLELKAFSPEVPPTYVALEIPQAGGQGIFVHRVSGERSRISSLGEDIAVDSDGKVWFTQGGANFYPDDGPYFNTSRIVSYDPANGTFECYNAPVDNAAAIGLLVDETRGMIWYSEGRVASGNAITGFTPSSALSDCYFDPYSEQPRDLICTDGPTGSCHWRFPLSGTAFPAHLAMDGNGDIWFTGHFSNNIGRLTPETGEIVELPLPPPIVREGPGSIVGSGPWELAFDDSGDLWVTEFFDATVVRVTPSLMESEDCEHLDAEGRNPCVEEVLVASDGSGDTEIHTASVGADGLIWFAARENLDDDRAPDRATVGFVSTRHGGEVVLLPEIEGLQSAAGIAQDPISRDVWFAQFWDHKIGRLHQLGAGDADGDGAPDLDDNCVLTPNAGQADFNSDGLGDACDTGDDDRDGCLNIAELGSNPAQGGERDPLSFWDFYDVPTGPQLVRDGGIALQDLLAVIARFNSTDLGPGDFDRNSDPLSLPNPLARGAFRSNYHPAYDRSAPSPGDDPWDTGPPDGSISMRDVFALMIQLHHECS